MTTPARYIELAKVIQEVAKHALRLDTRDATAIQAKVSIGLSLQAAELAGKAILRALGVPHEEILDRHKRHNIYQLLVEIKQRVDEHANRAVRLYGRFLGWVPIIDGIEFQTTLGDYFQRHFERGPSSSPRNYFYPDYEVFVGSVPIQAIYVMVEHIIGCAEQVITANSSCT